MRIKNEYDKFGHIKSCFNNFIKTTEYIINEIKEDWYSKEFTEEEVNILQEILEDEVEKKFVERFFTMILSEPEYTVGVIYSCISKNPHRMLKIFIDIIIFARGHKELFDDGNLYFYNGESGKVYSRINVLKDIMFFQN